MKKIAIYVAHGKSENGGYDPGAVNPRLNLHEHKISIGLCEGAFDELLKYNCEVSIFNKDASLSLRGMIAHANARDFDMAITIHLNAFTSTTATGTEAYYYTGDNYGKSIADSICKEVSKYLSISQRSNGIDDGGDKASTYYGFVREIKCTSLLLETCFITTDKEVEKVRTKETQIATGRIIAKGIVNAMGLSVKETPKPVPPKPVAPKEYGISVDSYFGNKFDSEAAENFVKALWYNGTGNYCRVVSSDNLSFTVLMQSYYESEANKRASSLNALGWTAKAVKLWV